MKFDLSEYMKKLVGDENERAVSPVIGVILMVAITVILAAVIAAFVMDIGDLDDSAPNAQFDWESDNDSQEVTVEHTSGDNIDVSDLTYNPGDGDLNTNNDYVNLNASDESWTAGDTVNFNDFSDGNEGTIQIVWEGDGSSTVIAEYDYSF